MDLIRISEAARLADVSPTTIRNQIKDKRLTVYTKGTLQQVAREEVLAVFGLRVSAPGGAARREGARVIAVANQKGGTGKTTTAAALATILARSSGPVLALDCDPQGNLTQSFGLDPDAQDVTLYNVFVDDLPLEGAMIDLSLADPPTPGVTLVPANLDLADTWRRVAGSFGLEALLKNALAPHLSRFRFVLLDCPPSLDMITINGLVAATEVIVPNDMSLFSVRGMVKLMGTLQEVRKANPSLPEPRILACRTDNTTVSQTIQDGLRARFHGRVFGAAIPRGKDIPAAQAARVPLPLHAPRSKATEAYEALAREVLHGF